MNASFSVTASPLVLGNTFVVAIYAKSAPNIALQTAATVGPYLDANGNQIPFQVMFSNLTPQLYIVELWETSNGTASGRIENSFVINIAAGNAVTNIRGDLFLIGGVTTGFPANSTAYSDPSLVGWMYRIVKEGYGILQPNIEYVKDTVNGGFSGLSGIQQGEVLVLQFQPQNATATLRDDVFLTANTSPNFNSGTGIYADGTLAGVIYSVFENGYGILQPHVDYEQDLTGGWHLIGRDFADGQTFVEMFQPNFQQQSAQPSPYSGTLVVTANVTLTNADMGKAIFIQGAGTHLTITLPLLATVNDFQALHFFSRGGNHINVNIVCTGTDNVQRNVNVSEIILAQDEQFSTYKALGGWQVDYLSPTADMVGQVVYSDNINEHNCILAVGQLVQRLDYNRLFKRMLNLPNISVSDSAWFQVSNGKYINKALYSMGTTGNDIRLPDFTNSGVFRAVDGNSRLSGSLQLGQMPNHDHVMHGKGKISNQYYLSNDNSRYSAGGGDPFGVSTNPDTDLRTGDSGTGTDNIMENTGIYKLIRI